MLYKFCKSLQAKKALEKLFFTILHTELSLSFKSNKAREVFAKYLGLRNYNQAKPFYDSLPEFSEHFLHNPFIELMPDDGASVALFADGFISTIKNELKTPLIAEKELLIRNKFLFPFPESRANRVKPIEQPSYQLKNDKKGIQLGTTPITQLSIGTGKTLLVPTARLQTSELAIYQAESDNYWDSLSEVNIFTAKTTILVHNLVYTCRVTPIAHSLSAEGKCKRTIIATPKSMMPNTKLTTEMAYNKKTQVIQSAKELEEPLFGEVIVISDLLMPKVKDSVLGESQVLWLYFPCRFNLITRTFSNIKDQILKAQKAVVVIDSIHSILPHNRVPFDISDAGTTNDISNPSRIDRSGGLESKNSKLMILNALSSAFS